MDGDLSSNKKKRRISPTRWSQLSTPVSASYLLYLDFALSLVFSPPPVKPVLFLFLDFNSWLILFHYCLLYSILLYYPSLATAFFLVRRCPVSIPHRGTF